MKECYEIVDTTDDENYFTLGVWPTLAAAVAALDECEEPNDLGSIHEDCCKVEVRQREIGWSGIGKKVHGREWLQRYNESTHEYEWRVRNEKV
jgi:hypothetical protein